MQKLSPKFIKFGPIRLGSNYDSIHFGLKLWSKNFDVIKLSFDHHHLYLILISKKIFWDGLILAK